VPLGNKGSILQWQYIELFILNTQISNYIFIYMIILSKDHEVPIHLQSTVSKTKTQIHSRVPNWLWLAMCTYSHLIYTQRQFPSITAYRRLTTRLELDLKVQPQKDCPSLRPRGHCCWHRLKTGTCISRANAFPLTRVSSGIHSSWIDRQQPFSPCPL